MYPYLGTLGRQLICIHQTPRRHTLHASKVAYHMSRSPLGRVEPGEE